MTPNELAAIRERAISNGLGRNLMNDCNQAIKDRRTLLTYVDEANDAATSFAQALSAVTEDNVRLGDMLQAIRELHTSVKPDSDGEHYLDPLTRKPICGECLLIYPCPTIQAIEGGTDGSQ